MGDTAYLLNQGLQPMNGLTVPFLLVGQSWNTHLVISVEDKRDYTKHLNARVPNPHKIIEACSSLQSLPGQALVATLK